MATNRHRQSRRKRTDVPATRAEHPNLTAFKQHGFTPNEEAGEDHVIGNCVFCGGDRFFVNVETKMWDCKHCGRDGGFLTFLQEVVEFCIEGLGRTELRALVDDRGISAKTLRHHQVGYNTVTNRFVIPVYDMNRENVWDIRIYNPDAPAGRAKIMSTAGCTTALYGWEDLQRTDFDNIWLCEGEWDRMVMWEIIQAEGLKRDIVVGVPGAGTFKGDWTVYFKDRDVYVVYDNDHERVVRGKVQQGAGIRGAIKVYERLRSAVHDMRFVHWPNKYRDKYDLRDYYNDHGADAKKTLKGVRALFQSLPKGLDIEEVEAEGASGIRYEGAGVEMQAVYDAFQKWLYLPDTTVLDVMFGSIIANRLPGDPLWLFIVDRSGGAKSVFLRAIEDSPSIVTTTSLTPHALISGHTGMGGGDPSLIPRLDGKMLTIKDFTTILNMNLTKRDEIFGILRDAYDGKIEWVFGNGKVCSYTSKFGILAGVTPAIELFTEGHTALGERFLRFRPTRSESLKLERDLMHRALMNTTLEDQMQAELSQVSQDLLNHDFGELPGCGPELQQKIIYLAQYVSLLRGTINRDKYSKEITHNPFTELGTRLTKQLYKLLLSIGQLHRVDNVGAVQFEAIKGVARSTVPTKIQTAVEKMYMHGAERPYSVKDIADLINLPTLTAGRVAENLTMLGVVHRIKLDRVNKAGDTVQYMITRDILELIDATNLFGRSKHASKTEQGSTGGVTGQGDGRGRAKRARRNRSTR
jgi:hypothetical protein